MKTRILIPIFLICMLAFGRISYAVTTDITNVNISFEIYAPSYPPNATWTVQFWVYNSVGNYVHGLTIYNVSAGLSSQTVSFYGIQVPNPLPTDPYQVVIMATPTGTTNWHLGYSDWASENSLETYGTTPVPIKLPAF
jgi:hypothetical protein